MKICLVVGVVVLLTTAYARSMPKEEETKGKGHTCLYNGVEYQEGEELPTRGKCLHCTCSKDFVEPSPQTCATIDCPRTWDSLCDPVYDPDECCPVSFNCSTLVASEPKCECEWRYFKHYEAMGCEPVYEDGCCPVRFDCSSKPSEDMKVCRFKGKAYAPGESIEAGPCEICTCEQYESEPAAISCITVECPSAFHRDPRLDSSSCYEVFEPDQCCPSDVKCDDETTTNTSVSVCELEGKVYHFGQQMYSEEDPCLSCQCDENWTGIHGSSCRTHDCLMERHIQSLRNGCLPIYHEATCCPIEMHCKTGKEEAIPFKGASPLSAGKESDSNLKCSFGGKSYNIGDQLDIKHPTNCVTCTCLTPPEFTCVHRRCPRPPNDDYENCHAVFTPGQCCPTYNCVHQQQAASFMCPPVFCPETCTEIWVSNGCSMCMCNENLCSQPECPSECTVDYDASVGSCPTCKCPEFLAMSPPVCDPVKCGPHCREAVSPQGCPICVCGPLCSPPKCDQGCEVEMHVLEGQCPGCICPNDQSTSDHVPKVMCSPVICPADCRETVGQNGCPMCDCDPLCSPPKCEPHCRLETTPSMGPCPRCVCGDAPKVIQCAPVKCGPGCAEVIVPNGCPMCRCADILCSAPKCPAGCKVNIDVGPGKCPECACPPSVQIERPICDPVRCHPLCHEAVSPQGCPMCVCGPLCSPPQCEPNCRIQKNVPEGQCPGCDCSPEGAGSGIALQIQCAPVKCARSCREALGRNGCPTCICDDVLCSPPRCDYGCRLRHFPNSPCPECVCDRPAGIMCAPVRCSGPCIEVTGEDGCPMCSCNPECFPPLCEPGCDLRMTSGPCPECVCGSGGGAFDSGIACSPPKCDEPGCRIDYSTSPCPSCVCDGGQVPLIQCSPPKCDPPCQLDYSTKPCPSCKCLSSQVAQIQCSPPRCDPGCQIDYSARPCPACRCGDTGQVPLIQCSPPKCDPPCQLDYNTKPCPSCKCLSAQAPMIACSPPKCDPPCRLDYSTKPCPSCQCTLSPASQIPCSPPKCDFPCQIDYSAKPCPSCKCDDSSQVPLIPCSPPKCDPPCQMDYSTKPCPSCKCPGSSTFHLQCSPPDCEPGCRPDYTTKPCPSCRCGSGDFPIIQCSPPKCEEGCRIDYSTKPCPSCKCSSREAPRVRCSLPKCEPNCRIDYSARPCPACACDTRPVPMIQCSPPRCSPGCEIDYTTRPCPVCRCGSLDPFRVACFPPQCRPGCSIDPTTKPCPSCKCDDEVPLVQCSPPKCDPGCLLDYSTKPCPSCRCDGNPAGDLQCAPVKCDFMCREAIGESGCPVCICGPECSMPRCRPGCPLSIIPAAGPCPQCAC